LEKTSREHGWDFKPGEPILIRFCSIVPNILVLRFYNPAVLPACSWMGAEWLALRHPKELFGHLKWLTLLEVIIGWLDN
jgi:hypothetical protein